MKEIKSILLPIDFSDTSELLAEYAMTFVKGFGAKLYILHVVEGLEDLPGLSVPHISLDKVMEEVFSAAKKELEYFSKIHFSDDVKSESSIVKGVPYDEILKFIDKNRIDMIIMGTHGRSGLDYLFFGSTADKVLRRAKCPVLTVKLIK